jgi:hypothetical protein
MGKKILTPDHKDWDRFVFKLRNLLFVHTEEWSPETNCKNDLRHTENILKFSPDIDVQGTIEFIKKEFGDCDCKLLTIIT